MAINKDFIKKYPVPIYFTESLLVVILMHASLTFTVVALEPPLTGGALLTFIFVKALVLWIIVAFLAQRGQLEKHSARQAC